MYWLSMCRYDVLCIATAHVIAQAAVAAAVRAGQSSACCAAESTSCGGGGGGGASDAGAVVVTVPWPVACRFGDARSAGDVSYDEGWMHRRGRCPQGRGVRVGWGAETALRRPVAEGSPMTGLLEGLADPAAHVPWAIDNF